MSKGGSSDVTVSTYYVGVHFVLCLGPIDKITKIRVDERDAWSGTSTGGSITINQPELFGGLTREGGVTGIVDIAMGEPSQSTNTYLTSLLGVNIPAFRGVVSIILNRCYVGLNYYLKPWAFLATRIHTRKNGVLQWQDSLAEVGTGLINGVHIIRDCLTDSTWGLGHAEGLIDEASFHTAAQVCYNEGLGFSFFWNSTSSVLEFISEVQKHIQATCYQNRKDGKFYLQLTRYITNTTGLIVLNPTNTKEVKDFSRKSIGDLVSAVTIKFDSIETYKPDSVSARDSALAIRQGIPIEQVIEYKGVATKDVAGKLAARDLQQLSKPVYSCTIKCDRTAEDLYIGSPFILDWPDYTDAQLLMRVKSLDLGTPTNGAITIEAVEDFFYAATIPYHLPPSSGWVDPIHNPSAMVYQIVNELPYYLAATREGDAWAQNVPVTDTYIVVAGVSPTNDSISAGIYSGVSGIYNRHGVMDFCGTGVIQSTINKTATSITIINGIDLDLITNNHFIQIDSELVAITNIVGNVYTIERGVMDTVPEVHTAGARIYGWHDFAAADRTTYVVGENINVKLTPITPKGELALSAAVPMVTGTTIGRMHLPYPPGNLQINSTYWPSSINYVEGLTPDIYWAYVVLCTPFNNIGGNPIDYSNIPKTLSIFGNSVITAAQSKYDGASISFDGTGDYVRVTHADLAANTGDFTIESWVYISSDSTNGSHAFDTRDTTTSENGIVLNLRSAAYARQTRVGFGSATFATIAYTAPLNTWIHVALVISSGVLYAYFDGVPYTTGITTGNCSNTTITIGHNCIIASGFGLIGYVDDLRITTYARYTTGFTPPGRLLDTIPATPINLTWASRNRLQQTAGLINYYTSSITSEPNVVYTATLKRTDTSVILDSFTGESLTAYTLHTSYIGEVRLDIYSSRDGFNSFQTVTHIFTII